MRIYIYSKDKSAGITVLVQDKRDRERESESLRLNRIESVEFGVGITEVENIWTSKIRLLWRLIDYKIKLHLDSIYFAFYCLQGHISTTTYSRSLQK